MALNIADSSFPCRLSLPGVPGGRQPDLAATVRIQDAACSILGGRGRGEERGGAVWWSAEQPWEDCCPRPLPPSLVETFSSKNMQRGNDGGRLLACSSA